jgi:DNA-binding HxlR family transcriptional regulator
MALFDLIGRRWTLRVIWELEQAGRPLTFRELRAACGDVSSSVLTRRLHELSETLIIQRTSAGYSLTSTGHALAGSIEPVLAWAGDWNRALARHNHHVPDTNQRELMRSLASRADLAHNRPYSRSS